VRQKKSKYFHVVLGPKVKEENVAYENFSEIIKTLKEVKRPCKSEQQL
jgi:hypothetical protein